MGKQIATKVLLYGVLLVGCVAFGSTAIRLSVTEPVQFGCFCLLALLAGTLKVTLPGIDGTMTVIHVIVLIGLANLSVPESLIAGVLATTVQCIALVKTRQRLIQVLFNLANVATTIVACGSLFSVGICTPMASDS